MLSANRATAWPFIRLYGLTFLFFGANSILNVIVPLRIASMGASNATIGFIMGSYMLTCMCLRPWAGHIVGKYGAVRVLRILLIINGLALLLYTVAGLEGFLAARLFQGASTAFFSMALQMGIIDALPDEERSQGISLYSLSTYMPTIAGPIIALGIWEWGGLNAFAVTMLALAVITGLLGYGIPVQADFGKEQRQAAAHGMAGAFSRIAEQPYLLICSLIMLAVSVVFGAVAVFIPLYAEQIAYGNAGIYFMLQAGVIVCTRFALRKRIPSDGKWRGWLIVGLLLLAAAAAMLLSVAEGAGYVFLYAAAIIMGVAQALLYPTLMTYLTFVLPAASRNIGLGLFIASADLGVSLGGIALGPVADLVSYASMFAVCSSVALAAVCAALIYHRKMSNEQCT